MSKKSFQWSSTSANSWSISASSRASSSAVTSSSVVLMFVPPARHPLAIILGSWASGRDRKNGVGSGGSGTGGSGGSKWAVLGSEGEGLEGVVEELGHAVEGGLGGMGEGVPLVELFGEDRDEGLARLVRAEGVEEEMKN